MFASGTVFARVHAHVVTVWPRITLLWAIRQGVNHRLTTSTKVLKKKSQYAHMRARRHIRLVCWIFEGQRRHWLSYQNVITPLCEARLNYNYNLSSTYLSLSCGSGMSGGETKGGVQAIQPKGTSVSPKQGPDVTVCGLKVNSFSHRPWIQATAGLHNFKNCIHCMIHNPTSC